MNLKIILMICLLLAVTGCQQKDTYDYLMLHPKELKKEFVNCQTLQSAKCEMVMRAADDFSSLLEDENNDPEAVGQKIIQTQQQLDLLLKNYEQAKQSGDKDKIQLADNEYQNQVKKLNILYAVVATRSPE